MMRTRWAVLTLVVVSGCVSAGGLPPSSSLVPLATSAAESSVGADDAAAIRFCDTMWAWYRTMAGRFNEMSEAARSEVDPAARRALMLAAFDDFSSATEALPHAVGGGQDPALARLAEQVRRDVPAALAVVDEMRQALQHRPDVDDERPQVRLSQLIVLMEKVVDLPKPEVDTGADPELVSTLRRIPSCQFSIRGVDDGIGRFNG